MSEKRKEPRGKAGTYFITGYPGFIGKRLIEHIVREEPKAHVYALVQPKHLKEAQQVASRLDDDALHRRFRLLDDATVAIRQRNASPRLQLERMLLEMEG